MKNLLQKQIQNNTHLINKISQKVKAPQKDLIKKIDELTNSLKEQQKLLNKLNQEKIKDYCDSILHNNDNKNSNLLTITHKIETSIIEKDRLQNFLDLAQNMAPSKSCCFTYKTPDSLIILVSVGQNLSSTLKAGQILKELCVFFEGKGGGRPDKARGILPSEVKEKNIFQKFEEIINQQHLM